MTRRTVIWLQQAQQELAQIWLDAQDRRAVTIASATLDAELAVDPKTKGKHLAEGLRKLRVPPLEVLFQLREGDRTVELASVKSVT
jgi:hypothetical protein